MWKLLRWEVRAVRVDKQRKNEWCIGAGAAGVWHVLRGYSCLAQSMVVLARRYTGY